MGMEALRRLDPWLPPLLLMAVIFGASAQPSLDSGLGVIDLVGRKLVHFGEYALLCVLWWRALVTRTNPRRAALGAFVIAALYAATDEFHQSFVDGRSATVVDWLIDASGAATAALVLRRRARRRAAV
jgi:VanZ family protein